MKLQILVKELESMNKVILFIDETHTLIGNKEEGGLDFANILKPALARGNIKMIGATTSDEYDFYIVKDKAFLRRRAKEYRKSLLPEEKARRDKFVTDNLFALDEFKNAKTVLCYVSSSREVDTSCIIKQAVLSGKIVAVPRCVDAFGHMEFCRIDSVFDLEPGAFGIMEPNPSCEIMTVFDNGICIVPALVFSEDGYRVGFGKGYYDRFLQSFSGTKIGLAYEEQIIKRIPHDSYDIKSDIIVSDKTVHRV